MSAAPETSPRLRLAGITKQYPAVLANDAVSLDILPGEIHAVLGENGAGKSTLMKIIYGSIQPDAGTLEWEGRPVRIAAPAVARGLGIGMVFQHFSLFETLTVAENIRLALDRRAVPARQLDERVREVGEHYGLPLDPRRLVHTMSVGERQRVEIVRCLLQKPRLLILDEPTSVLTPQAVQRLFETLRLLASEGCSIVYISHKLDEIKSLCDRATILRNVAVVCTAVPRDESADSLARLMIGADLPRTALPESVPGIALLKLCEIDATSADPFGTPLRGINLDVRAGEIVGIAGVSGNGQRELLATISGERRGARSEIVIDGHEVGHLDAGARRRLGLGLVPEERLGRGAVPALDLTQNALLTGLDRGLARRGWLRPRAARSYAKLVIDTFGVKAPGAHAIASSLSGGNLQKYIVGRETMHAPRIMVVAQPTWGVDVGAAAMIHRALIALRGQGVAVLVISEEIDELFTLCDRIAVIAGGRLSKAVPAASIDRERIGLWMSGLFDDEVPA
ncbi:ABC transporter ATP-binding protein [soil metagenome]